MIHYRHIAHPHSAWGIKKTGMERRKQDYRSIRQSVVARWLCNCKGVNCYREQPARNTVWEGKETKTWAAIHPFKSNYRFFSYNSLRGLEIQVLTLCIFGISFERSNLKENWNESHLKQTKLSGKSKPKHLTLNFIISSILYDLKSSVLRDRVYNWILW